MVDLIRSLLSFSFLSGRAMQSTAASRPGATESRLPSGSLMVITRARAGMERICATSVKLACGCRLAARLAARRAMGEATEVREWANIHTKPSCSIHHSCALMLHARTCQPAFHLLNSLPWNVPHRIDPSFAASSMSWCTHLICS